MTLTDKLRTLHRSKYVSGLLQPISRRIGENVYNRSDQWDILLILDASQYRIFKEISKDYDYITNVDKLVSRGSSSPEWTRNTYVEDYDKYRSEIRNSHYLTDNALATFVLSGVSDRELNEHKGNITSRLDDYVQKIKDPSSGIKNKLAGFYPICLDEIKQGSTEATFREPDIISNRALEILNEEMSDGENLVVHYMTPHTPFVRGDDETSVWPNEVEGRSMIDIDDEYYDKLIQNYRYNHRFMLDHVRNLVSNIPEEYDIAITSDHGNITGRILGINVALGHPDYMPFPKNLRHVPWAKVDQSEVQEQIDINPDEKISKSNMSKNVEDRLEDLGYI